MCTMLTSLRNSIANYFKPPRPPKRQSEKGGRLRISALRNGSAAQRSDCLQVGDTINAINGTKINKLNTEELGHILRNSNERIQLEVEYELPPPSCSSTAGSSFGGRQIVSRITKIDLEKENSELGGFGFTIRGGLCNDPAKTRSLVITNIRPNSPAEKNGTIQVGDRLVSVNGQDLRTASLTQAQKIIREAENKISIVIEYDICVVDTGPYAQSQLLVEVEKPHGAFLGIGLTGHYENSRAVYIDSVVPASIAERCGALHVGDQIVAIGDIRLDNGDMGPQEATQLLRNYGGDIVKLIIIPCGTSTRKSSDQGSRRGLLPPPSPRPSNCGTLNVNRNRINSGRSKNSGRSLQRVDSCSSSARLETASVASGSTQGSWGPPTGVLLGHPELVTVTLQIDCRGSYGLTLGQASEYEVPVVVNVEANSPSDRAGCIQPGDRILRINQQNTAGLHLDEVMTLMKESKPRISLDVEFDVADSVVPACGIFWVKLVKRGSTYGITLTAPKSRHATDYFVISEVRTGSVAHRTGSVQAGDKLLAINNHKADTLTLDEALHLLHNGDEVLRLKLHKGEHEAEADSQLVVYTVELVRHGGPLGITISGTESPNDPIIISGLTEGGLAERTGALHVGDRLLAINGRSLHGKLLSESIEILQNSGDVVTLKIGKSNNKIQNNGELEREDYLPLKLPPPPSIDSAVESWVSGTSRLGNNDNIPIYTAESATVRRRLTNCREWEVLSSPSVDSGQFETNYNASCNSSSNFRTDSNANPSTTTLSDPGDGTDSNCIRLSDLALVQRCNTLPRNYRKLIGQRNDDSCKLSPVYSLAPPFPANLPPSFEIHQITLQKDSVYEDFGFSVSDGLYERGVYVNRVRKGGPADLSGILQPYDRILQVNDTQTYDFDCCLTVPLIAAAGDSITIVVGRNPLSTHMDLKENSNGPNWEEEEEGIIPADADDCTPTSIFSGVRTITTTL